MESLQLCAPCRLRWTQLRCCVMSDNIRRSHSIDMIAKYLRNLHQHSLGFRFVCSLKTRSSCWIILEILHQKCSRNLTWKRLKWLDAKSFVSWLKIAAIKRVNHRELKTNAERAEEAYLDMETTAIVKSRNKLETLRDVHNQHDDRTHSNTIDGFLARESISLITSFHRPMLIDLKTLFMFAQNFDTLTKLSRLSIFCLTILQTLQ